MPFTCYLQFTFLRIFILFKIQLVNVHQLAMLNWINSDQYRVPLRSDAVHVLNCNLYLRALKLVFYIREEWPSGLRRLYFASSHAKTKVRAYFFLIDACFVFHLSRPAASWTNCTDSPPPPPAKLPNWLLCLQSELLELVRGDQLVFLVQWFPAFWLQSSDKSERSLFYFGESNLYRNVSF